ncbi:uncharacterized protein LOC129301837 [Prosopis cineraria]|uniref:uncharacterized protein LOC129301837 n=1 Tax=Prosopis cineraria TaxID=364024 RepID=UPI00240EBDFD|nr:uncharacterized protein LOC129301837 [Prosopis cineraria]
MNTRVRTRLQPVKAPMTPEKAEMQGSLRNGTARVAKGGKASSRDRKLALQQEVDRLKKKLRHEENIHRALERALNRPLGALPRLRPFLPPYILALLAEVAVLEEEIARLEEQVVDLRQDMYEGAVHMSSPRRRMENLAHFDNANSIDSPKPDKLKSFPQTTANSATTLPEDKHGKENQSCSNSSKRSNKSKRPGQTAKTAITKLPVENKSVQKRRGPPPRQPQVRLNDQPIAEIRDLSTHEKPPGDESPNTISENIVKCLSSILLRMSSVKNTGPADGMPYIRILKTRNSVEGTESWDPYGICSEFGKRDIGPYKQLFAIEAKSFNPKRTAKSLFLLSRLKLLFRKLASVSLENLNYQEKLLWINIYKIVYISSMSIRMNGVPESPEMAVSLMRKESNAASLIAEELFVDSKIKPLQAHQFTSLTRCPIVSRRERKAGEAPDPTLLHRVSLYTWVKEHEQ